MPSNMQSGHILVLGLCLTSFLALSGIPLTTENLAYYHWREPPWNLSLCYFTDLEENIFIFLVQ